MTTESSDTVHIEDRGGSPLEDMRVPLPSVVRSSIQNVVANSSVYFGLETIAVKRGFFGTRTVRRWTPGEPLGWGETSIPLTSRAWTHESEHRMFAGLLRVIYKLNVRYQPTLEFAQSCHFSTADELYHQVEDLIHANTPMYAREAIESAFGPLDPTSTAAVDTTTDLGRAAKSAEAGLSERVAKEMKKQHVLCAVVSGIDVAMVPVPQNEDDPMWTATYGHVYSAIKDRHSRFVEEQAQHIHTIELNSRRATAVRVAALHDQTMTEKTTTKLQKEAMERVDADIAELDDKTISRLRTAALTADARSRSHDDEVEWLVRSSVAQRDVEQVAAKEAALLASEFKKRVIEENIRAIPVMVQEQLEELKLPHATERERIAHLLEFERQEKLLTVLPDLIEKAARALPSVQEMRVLNVSTDGERPTGGIDGRLSASLAQASVLLREISRFLTNGS